MNFGRISMILAALSLTACEAPEERFARLMPAAKSRCASFGFEEGSGQYAICLQSEVQRMEDKEDATMEAIAEAMEDATPDPTTCYTTGNGYNSTTTCY